ncbi:unnamed protein product [Lathyrus sativus]|nr:unnamed protein product [Lathyrus sativus]
MRTYALCFELILYGLLSCLQPKPYPGKSVTAKHFVAIFLTTYSFVSSARTGAVRIKLGESLTTQPDC